MSESNYYVEEVYKINGERVPIDYGWRKSKFGSIDEIDKYREYLENKLGMKLFLRYRDYTKKFKVDPKVQNP